MCKIVWSYKPSDFFCRGEGGGGGRGFFLLLAKIKISNAVYVKIYNTLLQTVVELTLTHTDVDLWFPFAFSCALCTKKADDTCWEAVMAGVVCQVQEGSASQVQVSMKYIWGWTTIYNYSAKENWGLYIPDDM